MNARGTLAGRGNSAEISFWSDQRSQSQTDLDDLNRRSQTWNPIWKTVDDVSTWTTERREASLRRIMYDGVKGLGPGKAWNLEICWMVNDLFCEGVWAGIQEAVDS